MSIIKSLNEARFISFADPDNEPGAVDREASARADAAGRHFNNTQALLNDVAPHFRAKTRTWEKGHSSWDKQTWAELKFPSIETNKGNTLNVKIGYDSYHGYGYTLSVTPSHLRSEKSFVKDRDTAAKLSDILRHDWKKATGKELYALDVRVPLDDSSRDLYHHAIEIRVEAPTEKVPTKKYISGIESILQTLEMYL